MPIPEEQECASPPLDKKYDIPTRDRSKTSWKPRVTLLEEVNDLLDRGLMDNYDWESEHSATEEVPAMEVTLSAFLQEQLLIAARVVVL